jgi:hypothetical protein
MASKRRLRRRACEGKVRHTDLGAAMAHKKALLKKVGGHAIGAYRCKFCKGWHVGRRSIRKINE